MHRKESKELPMLRVFAIIALSTGCLATLAAWVDGAANGDETTVSAER